MISAAHEMAALRSEKDKCEQRPQEVIHAAPFRPFALSMADGTRIDVPHPDFIRPPSGSTHREWSSEATRACILLM